MNSRQNGADGLRVLSCSWMTMSGGNFQRNAGNGVNISGFCSDLDICGGNITDNGKNGIYCSFSGPKDAYFGIHGNKVKDNEGYGIRIFEGSPMINISRNDFIDNNGGTEQAFSDSICMWYHAGGYDNVTLEGNHWSDWTSPDKDQDGIVDTPYMISGDSGSKDMYPIVSNKLGYRDPYKRTEWMGLDFMMEATFFMSKVDPIQNPSEGYSSDQIDWYIEGEYIGTGDDVDYDPPSDDYTLTMRYKDPDGNIKEISRTFGYNYRERNEILIGSPIFVAGIVLLSISTISIIMNIIILRKANKKDREYSQNRFDIVRHEGIKFPQNRAEELSEIMNKAVDQRWSRKVKKCVMRRELDKMLASDEIDHEIYKTMTTLLEKGN
jgi:hypothetical protein